MSDLMTQSCEAAFVSFFGSFQELMIKSIEEEHYRFEQENEDAFVAGSCFKTILVSAAAVGACADVERVHCVEDTGSMHTRIQFVMSNEKPYALRDLMAF